jgi:hypothetical protein
MPAAALSFPLNVLPLAAFKYPAAQIYIHIKKEVSLPHPVMCTSDTEG